MMGTRHVRRGFTLIEAAFFIAVAVALVAVAWELLAKGGRTGRLAVEGLGLQQGVRAVVENMVPDVNSAYLILEPRGGTEVPGRRLELYRFLFKEASDRLDLNNAAGGAYPFHNEAGASEHKLKVAQIVYAYDPGTKTVTRTWKAGVLTARASEAKVEGFEFQEGVPGTSGVGPNEERVLASDVSTFEVYPGAYDDSQIDPKTGRGRVVDTGSLPSETGGVEGAAHRTCFVVLRIRAELDKGADVKKADDTSMEILTRIWSFPRLYDQLYRPHFSSVDEDLRY